MTFTARPICVVQHIILRAMYVTNAEGVLRLGRPGVTLRDSASPWCGGVPARLPICRGGAFSFPLWGFRYPKEGVARASVSVVPWGRLAYRTRMWRPALCVLVPCQRSWLEGQRGWFQTPTSEVMGLVGQRGAPVGVRDLGPR